MEHQGYVEFRLLDLIKKDIIAIYGECFRDADERDAYWEAVKPMNGGDTLFLAVLMGADDERISAKRVSFEHIQAVSGQRIDLLIQEARRDHEKHQKAIQEAMQRHAKENPGA